MMQIIASGFRSLRVNGGMTFCRLWFLYIYIDNSVVVVYSGGAFDRRWNHVPAQVSHSHSRSANCQAAKREEIHGAANRAGQSLVAAEQAEFRWMRGRGR